MKTIIIKFIMLIIGIIIISIGLSIKKKTFGIGFGVGTWSIITLNLFFDILEYLLNEY